MKYVLLAVLNHFKYAIKIIEHIMAILKQLPTSAALLMAIHNQVWYTYRGFTLCPIESVY